MTKVSGSTRRGRMWIAVRATRRMVVVDVIVRFMIVRWEGIKDSKDYGAMRERTRERRALTLVSLLSLAQSRFRITGMPRQRATIAMRATTPTL